MTLVTALSDRGPTKHQSLSWEEAEGWRFSVISQMLGTEYNLIACEMVLLKYNCKLTTIYKTDYSAFAMIYDMRVMPLE